MLIPLLCNQKFNVLVGAAKDWIELFVRPAIDTAQDRLVTCHHAHDCRMRHKFLKRTSAERNFDFALASSFAKTDEDIVLSILFDFLQKHIFSSNNIYNNAKLEKRLCFLQDLENDMTSSLKTSKSQ